MPLVRYFLFAGSLLLALLFLADRYLPTPATENLRADVDRTIIRIRSEHKWPEAVAIDTTRPTFVVPRSAVADGSPEKSPLPKAPADSNRLPHGLPALASAELPASPVVLARASIRPIQKRHARSARTNAGRIAGYDRWRFSQAVGAGWW